AVGEIAGCVDIAEDIGVEPGQFRLVNNGGAHMLKQRINLVLASAKRLCGDFRKLTAVNGAERLQTSSRSGYRHHTSSLARCIDQVVQKVCSEERQVHREHQIQFSIAGCQGSMDPAERPTVRKNIFCNAAVVAEFFNRTDNA